MKHERKTRLYLNMQFLLILVKIVYEDIDKFKHNMGADGKRI